MHMGVAEYQPAVSQQPSPTTYTTTPLFNTCLDHLLLSFLAFGCLGQGTSVLQRLNMVKVEGKFYNKTITSE